MTPAESQYDPALFDAVDIGLALLDGSRRVIGWNAWLATASGQSSARVLGRQLGEIFPGLASPRLNTAISHALELGASSLLTHSLHSAIFPLRTPTGKDLLHNISVRPIGVRPHLQCL